MNPTLATVPKTDPLGEILASRKLLEPKELAARVDQAIREKSSLEAVLLRAGTFSRGQLLQMLENHYFCPSADVTKATYSPDVLRRIPRRVAERATALPLDRDGERLIVALADPTDANVQALATAARVPVLPRVALRVDLLAALADAYDRFEDEVGAPSPAPAATSKTPAVPVDGMAARLTLDLTARDAPTVIRTIFEGAARVGATDIHFNPEKDGLALRFRMDGILHSAGRLPRDMVASCIARIKVMSRLDIAEHRIPQDGRQTIDVDGGALDLRVSTLPSQFGENVVIRLLRKNANLLQLDHLHMPAAIREAHADMVTNPLGFFLVTGPTGSGKTTTLYATLNSLDRAGTNIITLEDPIEYTLPGITQVQIQEDAGLSFASGLRSILRQDPDVVLVGEIRDLETVEIACRAALTGHKVLSTIHTNDACQAITRLLDMGTPPHLITATLRGVLAQRLVRVICGSCKEEYAPNETELAVLGYPKDAHVHHGRGCPDCANTGYKGRHALFEYFKVEDSIHRLILDRASPYAIRHAAERNGMIPMSDFARRAVLEGVTTVAEIQRVVLSSEAREQLCGGCGRVVGLDFSVCPFCQHVLKETCGGCGTAIDPSWDACPTCGRTVDRDWQKVFCRGCLAPVDPHWTQCRYCGEALG